MFSPMKKIILLLGAAATMFAAASCRKESLPETEFVPVTESVSATAEGGRFSIEYKLANPQEGLSVSASSEAEWISGFDCSASGSVSFEILPNDSEAQREDEILLEYGDLNFTVPVTQAGDPYAECDVNIECGNFLGLYYGDAYGTYTHFAMISDLPLDEFGTYNPEGTYYVLYLTRILDDSATVAFPDGTYTVDPDNSYADWTISTEHSYVIRNNNRFLLTSGTMTVSGGNDIDNTTFDLVLTLDDGSVHHATYTGAQYGEDHSIDWISEDVDMTATVAMASYLGDDADYGNSNINITLYTDLSDEGWVEVPGYALIMVGNVEYDETGHIVPGKYPISADAMADNAFEAGSCVSFMNSPFPTGTNLRYFYVDNTEQMVGLVESGSVEISGSGDSYTVECSFVTKQGVNVTAKYTGPLDVENAPNTDKYSKYYLTDDYELQFPAQTDDYFRVRAFSYDWYYDGVMTWQLSFEQYNSNYSYDGDQLYVEIVCPIEYTDGPMPGTYKVGTVKGEAGTVTPGTFEPDEMTNNNWPTYFQHMEDGVTAFGAAALGGELTLVKNDDGTYTIKFDFTDQQESPKHFTGEWTGTMEVW